MSEEIEDAIGPSEREIEELARLDHISLSDGEARELMPVIASLTNFDELLSMFESRGRSAALAERDSGYVPSAAENPFNAFIRRCRVRTSDTGPLAGLTVGLKDNIALARVPTTNGSRLTPFTPARDAVVVERILASGATIVGKLNMDDSGASGLGETSAFGPPRNPIDPSRSAGGSSGGSGAAVRSGEVDLALGVDQGGSGRIPAAFCGVVAAKPTHGLVPSQGIIHIDHTIDSITPIARRVADAARLLEVIAGSDDRDPQWVRGDINPSSYIAATEQSIVGLRIGVIEESQDPTICDPDVLANLATATQCLREAGARVTNVSIPLWGHGLAIFLPYIGHLAADMFRTEGQGSGHLGFIDIEAMTAYAKTRREESHDLARQMKAWIIADRYIHEKAYGIPYARLHNLRLEIKRQISGALSHHDLLLTPTLPMTAPYLNTDEVPFAVTSSRTTSRLPFNTAPLNLSGHPAISVPSGTDADGLPTAVQIVANHFSDATAFSAAAEVERSLGPF